MVVINQIMGQIINSRIALKIRCNYANCIKFFINHSIRTIHKICYSASRIKGSKYSILGYMLLIPKNEVVPNGSFIIIRCFI